MKSNFFQERTVCPICNNSYTKTIYSSPFINREMLTYLKDFYDSQGGIKNYSVFNDVLYELKHCKVCDLIFQKYIPNDKLMLTLYEEFINPEIKQQELYTGGRYQLVYFQKISREIEYLLKIVKQTPVKTKFLDYGMGWGLLCNMAKSYGCDVYGTELSPSRIEYAKRNGIKIISDNELKDIKFNIINLSDVLEHLSNPMQVIIRLTACLHHGGILRISVPSEKRILNLLKSIKVIPFKDSRFNCVAPLEHLNCFSSNTLHYLAQNNDYNIIGSMDYIYPEKENQTQVQKSKYLFKKYFLKHFLSDKSTNMVFQKK